MNGPAGSAPPLSLDCINERVHREDQVLKLTPKAFAVLRHLAERAGRLVSKEELLSAIWPDAVVSDGVLSTCVREIRRVLHDDPAAPSYIETQHRRGYRYVGVAPETTLAADGAHVNRASRVLLVGRDRELTALDRTLRQVQQGQRRVMFLAGETGIGKTALMEHFVAEVARQGKAQIARGQCVEQYGACEAYLPWLDALSHLSTAYGQARLAAILRRYARMWLAQLPWLIGANEHRQLQSELAGATRARMMRELAEALEALSTDCPVVVILEDLHWSDPSSIALLAYLARRRGSGALLLLGTYRSDELHHTSHPLGDVKQELILHGVAEELRLGFLTVEAVSEYMRLRLPGAPDDLAVRLHQRTDGSPLFLVNVIDYLVSGGILVHEGERWHVRQDARTRESDVPESLKDMIERRLDRLSPDERRVLEAASVAGAAYSTECVAAALDVAVESVEELLGTLARRGSFVRSSATETWPDGTQSERYEFIHVLYQNVLYDRIGTARRSCMHRKMGERLEAGFGDRAEEIAAVLALHFQRGRDAQRAVKCLAQAGESAIRRSAYVEAISLLNQGLDVLTMVPEGAVRDACELQLLVPLGVCYVNTRGYAASEVGATFQRARTLCRHVSDAARRYRVLRGMFAFAALRANLDDARSTAEELLQVAECQCDASGLVEGHRSVATSWFHLGHFAPALDHLQRALAYYDAEVHSSHAFLYGQEPGVVCFAWQAWTQWYLGYPDQALTSAMRSVALAREVDHPFSLSYALNFAAHLCLRRGEPEAAEEYARQSVDLAREHGLTLMLAMGQVLHGWSGAFDRYDRAAIDELEEGIARWRSTGARLMMPYWMCLLATARANSGRSDAASGILDNARREATCTPERWFTCDMHLARAALIARTCPDKSQRALREAFDSATELESPSLRLLAANALSPLLRDAGKTHEARELVGSAYSAFNEGFGTADLVAARAELGLSWGVGPSSPYFAPG